jgi:hypothetical protein
MKKVLLVALALLVSLPVFAATWENVAIVDAGCAKKVVDDPDKHPRACMLDCADSGFGVVSEGKFVKFDAKGDELAIEALNASDKKNGIRADVTGEIKDGVLHVATLTLK